MGTRGYFVLMLVLLPLVALGIGAAMPHDSYAKLLSVEIVFRLPVYVPFAAAGAAIIRRLRQTNQLIWLSLLAPPAYAMISWAAYLIWYRLSFATLSSSQLISRTKGFLSEYLLIGYTFVGVVWGLWSVARWLGAVRDELAT